MNTHQDCTIEDIVEFYKLYPELRGSIDVLTRYGYKSIECAEMTAKSSQVYVVKTLCGKEVKCSPEHLLFINGAWKKVNATNVGDSITTCDGESIVSSVTLLNFLDDLYDLQVAEVKEFYANGIVSHNSTICDVVCYAFYGKALRKINKPLLPNTKNGRGMLVECDFKINDMQYLVRRGMKPDVFEIYENGKMLDQDAASKDYQSILESKILRMSYTTFTQTVIVSKTNYTPFMQLTAAKRREFVEGILGLTIFGDMAKLQAKKIPVLKAQEVDMQHRINLTGSKINSAESEIERLQRIFENSKNLRDDELRSDIEKINQKLTKLNDSILDYTSKLLIIDHSVDKKHKDTLDMQFKLNYKLTDITRKLADLDNTDKCSMCGQDVTQDHIDAHKLKFNTDIDKVTAAIVNIDTKLNDITFEKNNNDNNSIVNKSTQSLIDTAKHEISILKNAKSSLESKLNSISNDSQEEIINAKGRLNTLQLSLDNEKDELVAISDNIGYNNIVTQMLKDSGIKSTIINRSIPIINRFINANLAKFGFFVQFELDREFEETIKSRGIDKLSYFSFSEGEKLRIDMAILLAWREVSLFQNAMTCNVLFLDEIMDSSMDVEGSNLLGTMLSELTKTNVFIVTHTPEKFDNIARSTIRFEKQDGYSRIRK